PSAADRERLAWGEGPAPEGGQTMSRGFARMPAALICSVFLLLGCAATQDTLAQQLAWERVEKCKGIGASLQVSRVEPDGRIWWQTQGGNQGSTEFYNCLRDAAIEQGK